jgi:hypothetical protein
MQSSSLNPTGCHLNDIIQEIAEAISWANTDGKVVLDKDDLQRWFHTLTKQDIKNVEQSEMGY